MAFWLTASGLLFVAAIALAGLWRRDARRIGVLETKLEASQDATWLAEELAERARSEGEDALKGAEERAELAARAKAKFLATVTHEMRTPLSGVIGTTDLLLDTALAPDQRTYARAVKQSAEAMLSLVDEILDLSRIDAGRLALQEAPFDLAELVEGVAELLAPRAQAKGLDLAVALAADAPRRVVGDAARIRQILLNLAGNAVKFTSRGGVGVRVDRRGAEISLSVHDTGPGFDPAEAERLFGEFEQGDAPAGGAGLGLAISRRLARAMGGALTAEGRPGEGATFLLTLPLLKPAESEAETPAGTPLAGRRVLVVSNAPFGGPWLVERIAGWGAEARLTGPEADVAAAAAGADTVLIDRAAAASAPDLAAAARQGGASRILLLLSPAERRELPTLAADGFDGYLVKPVRASSLANRLVDPRAERTAAPEAGAAFAFPRANGLRVLVAEDDPVSVLIALAHLSRLGHAARHAPDGAAACAAFEAERFDVVLLDLRMPGLDGCATARRIRAFEADTGRRPALLVALTANVGAEDREAALEAGADAVLAKPLDRAAIAALLEQRSAGSKVA